MREGLLAGLLVLGVGLFVVGGVLGLVAWMDERASRGWASALDVSPPLLSSPPAAGSPPSCGCGRLPPPEALPLELLLAGGVPVSVSRWFGGRRV